ncbi:hypothetical protein MNEG_7218 [Monoraphidium neglectum]|uniref:Uncharacterized protein n=1 Tax=Monoraphidium neglectum TaxID=145388 RepID=A0A0D2N3V2_9CHLO|nr:hypothetical protein MNEG_7218 [Monoraphidium neglectum]KIZ00746.1 hypothetical protein MNEG_7218 [Monoraphidium neglectum]|eukprot:XP_013899765.1 hypothetical protein MNEG_7218 [Monoraphidium neglectum]
MQCHTLSRSSSDCSDTSGTPRTPESSSSLSSSDDTHNGALKPSAVPETGSFAVFGPAHCYAAPLILDIPICGTEEGAAITVVAPATPLAAQQQPQQQQQQQQQLFTLQARAAGTPKAKARLRNAAGADVSSFDHAPSCSPGSAFRLHSGGRCVTSSRVGSAKTAVLRGQPCIKVALRGLPYVGIIISGDWAAHTFQILQHMPGRRSERLLASASPHPAAPGAVRLSVTAGVDAAFAVTLACVACASADCAADARGAGGAGAAAGEQKALPRAPGPLPVAPPPPQPRPQRLPAQWHEAQAAALAAAASRQRQQAALASAQRLASEQHHQQQVTSSARLPARPQLDTSFCGLAQLSLGCNAQAAQAAAAVPPSASAPTPLQAHMQQLQQQQQQEAELQQMLRLLLEQQQQQHASAVAEMQQRVALQAASLWGPQAHAPVLQPPLWAAQQAEPLLPWR